MPTDKAAARKTLTRVKAAQNKYWRLLSELETQLGCELDSARDFWDMTIDDLLTETES